MRQREVLSVVISKSQRKGVERRKPQILDICIGRSRKRALTQEKTNTRNLHAATERARSGQMRVCTLQQQPVRHGGDAALSGSHGQIRY